MIHDAAPTGRTIAGPPARHDLLTVDPARWSAVAATLPAGVALPPEGAPLVRRWGAAGWPVIARRPAPGDAPGSVPVGLPLPPDRGKLRVPLSIPVGTPWRPRPPVTLAEAAPAAPAPWRGTIADLVGLGRALGIEPHVFGALLWRAVTGLPYLGPGSDLDLLWRPSGGRAPGALLDGLARIAAGAPMAIDGEVITSAGGVQWRELAEARRGRGGLVLAKSLGGAGLVRADALLSGTSPDP